MMWYLSTELSAGKFVDNVNVVNYTFLPQIYGDLVLSLKGSSQ